MLSALLGLVFILLIALVSVALGALARLIAARVIGSCAPEHRDLTIADRLALGDERIARDLQPDDVHPVARTAPLVAAEERTHDLLQRQELALRHPAGGVRALG